MVPYERIIQWISGPFAVLIGGVAAKWVSSWGFLGQLGFTTDQTAKAITASVVFALAAGVTILSHQRWMANLAKWWEVNTAPVTSSQPVGSEPKMEVTDDPNPQGWLDVRQSIAEANPVEDPHDSVG